MRGAELLIPRPEGLYCPPGDFYIDPVRPVARALITHAHSDHAIAGHGAVLATRETLDIMAIRLGDGFAGATAGRRLRRAHRARRGHRHLPPRRPRARLGADRRRGAAASASSPPATTSARPTRPAPPSSRSPATSSSPRRPSACRSSATPTRGPRSRRLLHSLAQFPERTHLVGVYALGKAQRLIRLLRDAGHDGPIYLHGALRRLCDYYAARGIDLGDLARRHPRARPRPRLRRRRSCSGRPRPSPPPGSAASPTR